MIDEYDDEGMLIDESNLDPNCPIDQQVIQQNRAWREASPELKAAAIAFADRMTPFVMQELEEMGDIVREALARCEDHSDQQRRVEPAP